MRCADTQPAAIVPAMPQSSDLATIDDADTDRPTRPIPKRIRQIVDLITSGECKNVSIAAERVGLHRDYVYRALKRSDVQVFIARKSRETIANGLMRASARLNELVDADSEHVSFDAAKHIAAIAGIKPAHDQQVSVSIDIKAGYVIDISPQAGAPSGMSHTHTIEAKALKGNDNPDGGV